MFSDPPLHAPKVLVLHAPGTNRDGDLATAVRIAGGDPVIYPLGRLKSDSLPLDRYAMLALPGGFSYGDALGAGRLWALEIASTFEDAVAHFVDSGKPVIGICNGFQALVKAGVLTGPAPITLTFNASGRFECRWVRLLPNPENGSPWLRELPEIECPVAHGEGRFLVREGEVFPEDRIALQYASTGGEAAGGKYPANPNGSLQDIAGITNEAGNVLGLMPHPEDHIYPWQHPTWTRGANKGLAVQLFENGLTGF